MIALLARVNGSEPLPPLNYQVADASVTEFAKGFLESLCADVNVAVDYRIEAGELLRKHEAPRVLSESVRPSYREEAGTEAERMAAWRNYDYQQRKWKIVMDTMATSLDPDAPYRLPPGWCDDIYPDDYVPPPGWPPW